MPNVLIRCSLERRKLVRYRMIRHAVLSNAQKGSLIKTIGLKHQKTVKNMEDSTVQYSRLQ